MTYDYSKLRGRIVEKLGSNAKFAEKMGYSERTISLKLNNKSAWSQKDITKASKILGIEPKDLSSYFFYSKCSDKLNIERRPQ